MAFMLSINPKTHIKMVLTFTSTKASSLKIRKTDLGFNGAITVFSSANLSITLIFHIPRPFFCIVTGISLLVQYSITREMGGECYFNRRWSRANTINTKPHKNIATISVWLWDAGKMMKYLERISFLLIRTFSRSSQSTSTTTPTISSSRPLPSMLEMSRGLG